MLEAKFSGRHPIKYDSDDELKIDRDSDTFTRILFFMKHKIFPKFKKNSERQNFREDLDYFCIGIESMAPDIKDLFGAQKDPLDFVFDILFQANLEVDLRKKVEEKEVSNRKWG
jgi:hypothetical protein